jgi:hypothetical protein
MTRTTNLTTKSSETNKEQKWSVANILKINLPKPIASIEK